MTPSATVSEFIAACQRLDPAAIVALLDSSYLDRWRRSQLFTFAVWCDDAAAPPPSRQGEPAFLSATEWSIEELEELLTRHASRPTPFVPGTTLGELAQWPAPVLMRRLLEAAVAMRHRPPPSAYAPGISVIGEVAEDEALCHVLCRSQYAAEGPGAIEIFTLRRDGTAWRLAGLPYAAEVHFHPDHFLERDRGPSGAPAA